MKCSYCKNRSSESNLTLCSHCLTFKAYQPNKVKTLDWLWVRKLGYRYTPPKHDYDLLGAILYNSKIENKKTLILKGEIKTYRIPITVKRIDELAKRSAILGGKWLVYASDDNINKVWQDIAKATIEGKLGVEAKVSTSKAKPSYVICIYTSDFLDKKDVMRVRKVLYEMGFKNKLSYKPDIYTYLGIYARTTNIKPSRYYF